jgi:hypothetical protein
VQLARGQGPVSGGQAQRDSIVLPVQSYRLTPDDLMVRDQSDLPIPSLAVRNGVLLLALELPCPWTRQGTRRAVLKTLMNSSMVLSENVAPSNERSTITLLVPAQLLHNNQEYMIELQELRPHAGWQTTSSFSFHLDKE